MSYISSSMADPVCQRAMYNEECRHRIARASGIVSAASRASNVYPQKTFRTACLMFALQNIFSKSVFAFETLESNLSTTNSLMRSERTLQDHPT